MRWIPLSLLPLCLTAAMGDVLDYVAAPDPSFTWQPGATQAGVETLTMTSQTWQGIAWNHTVSLYRPRQAVAEDICLLYITGGNFRPDSGESVLLGMLAQRIGVPVAVLWNIPNQPLYDNLREDALIAYTFLQAAQTGDESWPLPFPMAKSAVRAMDAISAHSEQSWGAKVTRFVTTGASKRGWTTWFSAVVDPRVVAIAPMVYDNLDLPAQMTHHLELWGQPSPAIHDYTDMDLITYLTTPAGARLAAIVDPYTYRDRITMPKLILNGANDQYWTVDSLNLYRDQLVGETNQLYLPDSQHGMEDRTRLINTLAAFVRSVARSEQRPTWSWQHGRVGRMATLAVNAPTAQKVSLWTNVQPTPLYVETKWTEQALTQVDGVWFGAVPVSETGYLALFGEATFDSDTGPYTLSTTPQLLKPEAPHGG